MPHVILEYSSNIEQEIDDGSILGRLFETLSGIAGIAVGNCKGRIIDRGRYRVGTGEKENAFIHCSIRMLEGRSKELKGRLGKAALMILKDYFSPSASVLDLQITVEIEELERGCYFKEPPGTLGERSK